MRGFGGGVLSRDGSGGTAPPGAAAAASKNRRGDTVRIALFVTCLADTLFPGVGQSTVRLLERLGHGVEFPPTQ